jgi:hypothetical protein
MVIFLQAAQAKSAAKAKLHLHVIYIYIPNVQVYILGVFEMKHQD